MLWSWGKRELYSDKDIYFLDDTLSAVTPVVWIGLFCSMKYDRLMISITV